MVMVVVVVTRMAMQTCKIYDLMELNEQVDGSWLDQPHDTPENG